MRCIIRWNKRQPEVPEDGRLTRLETLFSQASRSGYYRRREITLPQRAPREDTQITPLLGRIPPVELADFLRSPAEFYNWGSAPRPARPLEGPLGELGRTALLAGGFAETTQIRVFTYLTLQDLEEFRPDTLAGPVSKLRTLAMAVLSGSLTLDSLRHAVIAFTGLKHGCLRPEDRDLFWRAFQVPVFEQFRGFAHELLAWECEAHDGLHIVAANAIFETSVRRDELLLSCLDCAEYSLLRLATELSGQVDASPCGCGNDSPRLMGVRDRRQEASHDWDAIRTELRF